MAAPPARTEIANTYPAPSNDTARTGFGRLWDYVTGLLGATGNAPEARAALGVGIRGHLAGLTMSTAGSSTTMTIAAGEAVDSTNSQVMMLASAINKTTAAWAVGNNQGGLDTGAIANNAWYNFFEIKRPDTGVVDVIFSLSATTPTMPANYTLKRRIGAMRTNGSGQWERFVQDGDLFQWRAGCFQEFFQTAPNSSAVGRTLSYVPSGVRVIAILQMELVNNNASGNVVDLRFTDLDCDDTATVNDTGIAAANSGYSRTQYRVVQVRTNASAQIRTRADCFIDLDAGVHYSGLTRGYIDRRGRDA